MLLFFAFLSVAAIGAAVGVGELVSRYRDDPVRATSSTPGVVYVSLNALAAVGALALAQNLGWASAAEAVSFPWVLACGFGAVAVLRTSIFTVRAGAQDISVGPSVFLQVVLQAADREVDRRRATQRALAVDRIMQDVSFDKANESLPAFCLALLQNMPQEEQERLARDVVALSESSMEDDAKVRALGLVLMNTVGEAVLEAAVRSLGDKIKKDPVLPLERPLVIPSEGTLHARN